ncbi:TetR/AcrR family transcriptional regulator [Paenarthrobacter aromaticivorans]|uniref:TetR/AcrR family transcriptional regulator n=1 Tax=Paenarthrobacter aromaticivorans TaxID=2849150 RepID=A0ABS6I2D9_9MICC|nr:TetR/AcrR family transcriptional regulator [Paenarthrobacter sp. MMS21-TAE1-1]MBU8865903.1 TetR/AcrR family transcriptional regulator [Paenarthrobacter sp. MMS21-TAE1-1]
MKISGTESRSYNMSKRASSAAETGRRILQATEDLFMEGPLSDLTLNAVAERAGVTVQTVIRRFRDRLGLINATAEFASARVMAQRDAAPAGDVRAAVENLIEHYETTGALALKLLAEESSSPVLAEIVKGGRQLHRQWCERVFDPFLRNEPDRDRRLAQFVALCDVYTWKLLRHDAGLGRDQVTLSLLEMLEPFTRRP